MLSRFSGLIVKLFNVYTNVSKLASNALKVEGAIATYFSTLMIISIYVTLLYYGLLFCNGFTYLSYMQVLKFPSLYFINPIKKFTRWRTMLYIASIPRFLLTVGMHFAVDSPRWLCKVRLLHEDIFLWLGRLK